MNNFFNNKFFLSLYCLIPLALITGPFIPDLIVLILSFFIIFECLKNKIIYFLKDKIFLFFIIFFVSISLSIFVSDIKYDTFLNTLPYIRFILFTFGAYHLIRLNNNSEKILINLFSIIFIILFIDGLYQFIFMKNIFNYPIVEPSRVSSFFFDELILGSYIVRFFPIFLFLILFFSKKEVLNLKLILFFFISLILILMSGERTAIYLFVIQMFLFLLLIKNHKFEKLISIIIILCSIFLVFTSENKIKKRFINDTVSAFSNENKFEYKNTDHYFIFNDFKLVLKNQNKLLGVGVKNFGNSCEKFANNEINKERDCPNHPHNIYLQLINETGFLGFFIFSLFFVFILKEIINLRLNFYEHKYYNMQLCILISIFTNFFPISQTGDFFNNWLSIVFFFPIPIYLKYRDLINY